MMAMRMPLTDRAACRCWAGPASEDLTPSVAIGTKTASVSHPGRVGSTAEGEISVTRLLL
jgi:hypothetical protein